MMCSNSSSKATDSREELEKLHNACLDGNHKWHEEKLIICTTCGMYQDEYNDRKKK